MVSLFGLRIASLSSFSAIKSIIGVSAHFAIWRLQEHGGSMSPLCAGRGGARSSRVGTFVIVRLYLWPNLSWAAFTRPSGMEQDH